MGTLNSREEIIKSLLTYLPDISESLYKIVNLLKELNEKDIHEYPFGEHFVEQFGKITNLLQSVIEKVPPNIDVDDCDKDLFNQYIKTIRIIIVGIKILLDCFTSEQMSQDELEKSIDLLFTGGQEMINLVNKLTQQK